MTPEMINALTAVGFSFIAFIVWLVRLEGLVRFRERECSSNTAQMVDKILNMKADYDKQIDELKSAHSETKNDLYRQMQEISKTMNQILQSVSKIQGNIEGSQKHGSD